MPGRVKAAKGQLDVGITELTDIIYPGDGDGSLYHSPRNEMMTDRTNDLQAFCLEVLRPYEH